MGGLANGAVPAALEDHDDRLRALEVDVAKLSVAMDGLRHDVDQIGLVVGKFGETLDAKLDKLGDVIKAHAAASTAFFDKLDARLAPLERQVGEIDGDIELAKKWGTLGVKKIGALVLALLVGAGAGPTLIDALKGLLSAGH